MELNTSNKIKSLLAITGKKNKELAEYMGILPQSLNNKLSKGNFTVDELIKIATFTGAELTYIIGDSKIILSSGGAESEQQN